MEQPTHASRLRFLAASDVDDSVVDYDGLEVRGADDQRVGEVDGFIVDGQARRLHYVVVDAGGWFSSTRVLVPVGHANLSRDRRALRLDVTRKALSRYQAFHRDRYREFANDEPRRFETRVQVDDTCGPDEPAVTSYATQRHDTPPGFPGGSPDACERLRPVDTSSFASMRPIPVRDTWSSEHVRAHAEGYARPLREGDERPAGEAGTARSGERTRVHDAPRDPDRPRRVAQRAPGDEDDTRRSER